MLNSLAIATEGIGFNAGPIALVGFWSFGESYSKSLSSTVTESPSSYSITAAVSFLGSTDAVVSVMTARPRYTTSQTQSMQGGWWGRPWGQPWGGFPVYVRGATVVTDQPRYTVAAVPTVQATIEPECE